jgi:hypothetical protein
MERASKAGLPNVELDVYSFMTSAPIIAHKRLIVAIAHCARKKNVVGVLPLPLANRKCGDAS